jgi:hypothetical protein
MVEETLAHVESEEGGAATLEKIQEDYNFNSSAVSERARHIALSIIAVVWLFLADGEDKPVLSAIPSKNMLIAIGAFALLSMIFDYLQYLISYSNAARLYREAESQGRSTADYNYDSCGYKLRLFLFEAKQYALALSVVLLVYTVGSAL